MDGDETFDLQGNGLINLNGATTTIRDSGATVFSGLIRGTGGVTIASGTNGVLSGMNSYSGGTTINNNAALHVNGTSLLDAEAVILNGTGNLSLFGSETIGSLTSASSTSTVTLGANTLTTGGANTDTTFAGEIAGTGGLTKTGTGTLQLTGSNTCTGSTTVCRGTLVPSGGAALANTASVTVAANAMLVLTESEQTGALASDGTLDLSAENGTADTVLTVNSNYSGSSVLVMDVVLGDDGAASDRLVVTGNATGITQVFVVNGGGAGAATRNGILLVDVTGSSGGDLVLANGDILLADNVMGLSAGQFVYALRNVGGDWFL